MVSNAPVTPNRHHSAHELRWTYVRGCTRHECALRLATNPDSYEFRVVDSDGYRRPRLHTFSEAFDALEWHSLHEAALLRAGFSLEAFDTKMQVA